MFKGRSENRVTHDTPQNTIATIATITLENGTHV
jgi:hypothetical protein